MCRVMLCWLALAAGPLLRAPEGHMDLVLCVAISRWRVFPGASR
jgi:hypothetical protein